MEPAADAEGLERGRVAPISSRAERTMDALLADHPEFTALKFIGRTSEEVTAVTNALRDNSSITALYEMQGGEHGVTDEGLRQLSKVLRLNSTITKLHIASDAISNEGLKWLSEGLLRSQSVIRLSLWSGSIEDQGLHHLATALTKEECMLQELFLSLGRVTEEGAGKLQEAIQVNARLEKFQLEM
eukprot:TRINITY_DN1628_c0_g1_i1.p1 TRINITY_DN1628_c0_g1~~TRINITY_DN1628_c0_g1_i1.p1  ORF type:complete len:186 (-),score=63.79 TRINITY_DN1628_c0_g1_i1:248-805(-)